MRKIFSKFGIDQFEAPNLVQVQLDSYKWFLDTGLRELLKEVSPTEDWTGKELELRFLDYKLDEPKYKERTAIEKNITYEAPLKVKVGLRNKRTDQYKEQELFLSDFPLMTPRGTFIINGVERVVISQLIRSPGVFFSMSRSSRLKRFFGAKLIPSRGAWLEFETEYNGVISCRIDRKRKVPATALLRAFGITKDEEIKKLFEDVDTDPNVKYILATILADPSSNEEEGLIELYKRIRPGDPATPDNARQMVHNLFFNASRYDLSKVGRFRMNKRFNEELALDKTENRILRKEDIVLILREIINLNNNPSSVPDNIDHLGNRRVKTLGELLQDRLRIAFARMERITKDRMSTSDIATILPSQLINARPFVAALKEFFASGQLSQFMDQHNPLSELEHKRRLSALGPGGLTRERASFEVRDVHPSHYGRICPIATPEGPNIGLVGHLSLYAKISDLGFILTPYRKVIKGKVTDELVYMDAVEEERYIIASAGAEVDKNNQLAGDEIVGRIHGEPGTAEPKDVQYMDISPRQMFSVSTSLIPFLEHDDANRALMGSNMQRQAVPLIQPESPYVGTGLEGKVAKDSGMVVVANEAGTITAADASRIVLETEKGKEYEHKLLKFARSNAFTCLNQRVLVKKGDKVKKGQALADGPSTQDGEIALGKNLVVAYMSYEGCNFQDAIVISERLVKEDVFSSIHIEDYSTDVRETKLGPELTTYDIPNVAMERLNDLDPDGIVRVGAEVRSQDILVGKISPKGESDLTAEERLLRAIFGDKSRDVKDSSLRLDYGKQGRVVDVKVFSREEGDKLDVGVIKKIQVSVAQLRKAQVGDKLAGRHGNKGVISTILPEEDMPFLEDGTPVDIILSPLGIISRMNIGQVLESHLGIAAKKLGYKAATPAMAGPTEETIKEELEKAGYPVDGKMQLYDGKTGKAYDAKCHVGVTYFMKLIHMVEDKLHMRSIGPYSLITQQPLGGKAQFGGQRFGEMEVWALEGYGAAHTLQEMLTIKSDDVLGRAKTYESIVNGEEIRAPHLPESFKVLLSEIKGLGLNVELIER
ncbi:MAG: DNA-directed RNA polymerase subunit beta [Candidatus Yanofskybacteria bacterium RIFCSPLOWO2_02_FULL_43_10]|uniref:DNA-directed RNA polymerase subunit beta n=1 Tax=Candidatus Yanofskybacteria bacterium RIFCSPLOWO2_12_FULL_43_11b TaxID=1802710 RepID=A0A1F8HAG9_9BACT|nr:MAG: DNA-directed RNA polymerase subunit beta [Candidatus Yanofskybacteria bacterium RIFCSPHIGHO2_01_FULL_43_32]OGN12052.1 MAG: DNA-directed RNA polymerase subunit beta [Candidatus Yanofskybacteria bacterium RIFCSPHIGHO2_02_FULL_43_12]OGN18049.1 MAG: DNA-directed RNA polymerase subunit beta [Candidatus Yanofskybacteria bacterium RIFCSPHIGHO2_12_FULL_43_11]OGN25071.1 MAG: DNA-directed RNA polymerase subunit beta [Candidatus Yanofskybacteria bacterium RIFCSPLOWO2_01_FULL_43_46]OGN28727.1 MAG: 